MLNAISIIVTIGLNSFFPTILMIIFIVFNSNILGVQIGLLSSLLGIMCQIFSMHSRNVILTSKKNDNNLILLNNRIFLSLIFLVFVLIFLKFNNLIFISFVPIILFFWVNEILISIYERKKYFYQIKIFFFIILIYILSIILIVLIAKSYLLINLNIVFLLIFILNLFYFQIINKNNYKNNYKIKTSITLNFLSSLSFILPVFIWRYFIYENYDINYTSLYFLAFAIASLPGTLFLNVIGVTIIKLKLEYLFKLVFYFLLLFLLLIIFFKSFFVNFMSYFLASFDMNEFYSSLLFSLLGSLMMIIAIFKRTKMFIKLKDKSNIYFVDIINSILICCIVPCVIVFKNNELLKFSFLFSGLISFISYHVFIRDQKK